jgi:signal transduction histidine kinase
MALFAIAALRVTLLGRGLPPILPVYALGIAVFWVTLQFAVIRWLDSLVGLWTLAVTALALVCFAVLREVRQSSTTGTARREELVALGRFSEQLAHDLRNPLAVLKGSVQFLAAEGRAGGRIDEHADFLTLMQDQLVRMERVVSEYQRIAKVEPAFQRSELNGLVRDVLSLQCFAVPGVELELRLADGIPECVFDPDLVATALENILQNAYESMPEGGTVSVRTEYTADQDQLSVIVEDTGGGMDPRDLERASDAFFTTKASGSGIGLHFADRVARAHGGRLRLVSSLGRGTIVRLSMCTEPGVRA